MKGILRPVLIVLSFTFILVIASPVSSSGQTCGSWVEVVSQSFFPKQVDEKGLHEFASISPEDYLEISAQREQAALAKLEQSASGDARTLNTWDTQQRMQAALARFYEVGAQLYGVRLNPENVTIIPSGDVNAFATGSRIFVNEGLVNYFLQPESYMAGMLGLRQGSYTPAQYNWLQSNFGWQEDWNSIYFTLAHEAAHNLMRHVDARVLESVLAMSEDYRRTAENYRKDLAEGRNSGGAKRYIWQSFQNFAAASQNADEQRAQESEADLVGMLILQRAGLNPAIAVTAGQRMLALFGVDQVQGWQQAMTKVFCSSHPDWLQRIQKTQTNLDCLQLTGNLCQRHTSYPVVEFFAKLREEMERLDSYQQETVRIAEGDVDVRKADGQLQAEVDPKDARLTLDGESVSPGKLRLTIGSHTLAAEKDGYDTTSMTVVVFPDVQGKVKLKMKKARR
jgi:Zn-dependent protease with chaperone function